MDSRPEKYVLRGDKGGYDRLLVLARDRWPDTMALLDRAGVGAGMRCVDLGCGSGQVTAELARMVTPGGEAVGVDMNPVNVQLAREAAASRGVANLEFRQMDVSEWNEPGRYDVAYSRALLQHLRDPVDLLERMWAGLRPGGVILIEDADFDGWGSDPPSEGLRFFVRTYSEVLRRNGGDPTVGRKLHRHFRAAGIPEPQVSLVQPMRFEGEAKWLAWSTLEASREAILSAGIATPTELAASLEELARLTEDPESLILGPRMFQAWARRPASA